MSHQNSPFTMFGFVFNYPFSLFPTTTLEEFLCWILNSWVFANLKSSGVLQCYVYISHFLLSTRTLILFGNLLHPLSPCFLKKKKRLSCLFIVGCTTPHAGLSSLTRDRTHAPCTGSTVLTTGLPGKLQAHMSKRKLNHPQFNWGGLDQSKAFLSFLWVTGPRIDIQACDSTLLYEMRHLVKDTSRCFTRSLSKTPNGSIGIFP